MNRPHYIGAAAAVAREAFGLGAVTGLKSL
jgi:hypothetical protein